MSLIIRDFDMPKAGEVLILKIYPDRGVVKSPGTECEARDNIVVPIPMRHGRLIDADAINKALEEWKRNPKNDEEAVTFVSHFQGIIRTAPTILEAEK